LRKKKKKKAASQVDDLLSSLTDIAIDTSKARKPTARRFDRVRDSPEKI